MGGKEFINLGAAGGLAAKGIFVCNKAVRDEGTSHHYLKDGLFSYPDKELTARLEKTLKKNGVQYAKGASWTIDAPYMETKKEIDHYKKIGIKTVEMEASALFAVAKVRKVKIASLFVVSDVLGEKWEPLFHQREYRKTLNKMIDVAIQCLSS
jgi:purine-nucleoside phosphorylase